MQISDKQQVNHYETDFFIYFLGDFHSEQNEQEICYEHIQENFQDDQRKIYLSLPLERLNTYQSIYDNYDSKLELNIKEEHILQT
jgi:hypothetical protein